jgi:hypothetical protein
MLVTAIVADDLALVWRLLRENFDHTLITP